MVRDSRGALLIGAVLIMLTMALIGGTLATVFFSVMTVAQVELERAQALYLAEAGIARAVSEIKSAGSFGGEPAKDIPSTVFGDGEYEVHNDVATGLITATGRVHQVERTIQIKYQPF